MSDQRIDPERQQRREGEAFDRPGGYSGQDYHVRDEHALGGDAPSGTVNSDAQPGRASDRSSPDIPPDNGRRASFDASTGEVHGSGVGAGGGAAGEDFSSNPAAGDGFPQTGVAQQPAADQRDLGPAPLDRGA